MLTKLICVNVSDVKAFIELSKGRIYCCTIHVKIYAYAIVYIDIQKSIV